MQSKTIQYDIIEYNTIRYNTVQYNIIQYDKSNAEQSRSRSRGLGNYLHISNYCFYSSYILGDWDQLGPKPSLLRIESCGPCSFVVYSD